MNITKEKFGIADGKEVGLYTLINKNGMMVKITNYGAIVQTLTAPDKTGKYEDIVLGYDKPEDYLADSPYFGAIVGRYGNRIKNGKFSLNGMEYSLTNENELSIEYFAETDKDTPVNLTHHGYFNLSGNCKTDILNHKLWINADRFTPVDSTLIPTGELHPVQGTAFDFTTATAIGVRVDNDDEQLKFGLGYDHNWVLNDVDGTLKLQASLYEEKSGRYMEVYTVEPGLQFYSGNFLDGSNVGKGGKVYNYRNGLCLETQHFPDSPSQPEFPSTILRAGETYKTKTIYRFTTK